MKNFIKLFLFIVFATILSSFTLPQKTVSENDNSVSKNVAYSIEVCLEPTCPGAYVRAVRQSDGATFMLSYDSSTGCFYTSASGLGPGVYSITVCCGGFQSAYGSVTLTAPYDSESIKLNLQNSPCQDV